MSQQYKFAILPETEFIVLVWNGLASILDMGMQPGQLNDNAVKEITVSFLSLLPNLSLFRAKQESGMTQRVAPVLAEFCTKAATEIVLINTIQIWCYENTKTMPAFAKLLKVLYSKDVLSDQGIIYWYSKGSKIQGRASFLAAAEPLVTFLQEQEDESEEDEDDE